MQDRISRRAITIGALASIAVIPSARAQERSEAQAKVQEKRKTPVLTPTEQLMHSTVMIRSKDDKGNLSAGTGFIFHFFNHNGQNVPALVTNKHVIRNATDGMLVFTESNDDGSPKYGSNLTFQITDFSKGWLEHSNAEVDLTIFPLSPLLNQLAQQGKKPFIVGLDQSLIPTEDGYHALTPLEDVLIVGYPDGISDTKNNVPVFRKGISATPVYLDFMGKREFLVDAAIFPGSSGSPVFLFNQGTWLLRDGTTVAGGYRVQLLGVIYAVALHATDGEIIIVPAPTQARAVAKSQIPNNLGLCIKASRILEFEPILIQKGVKAPDGYKIRASSP